MVLLRESYEGILDLSQLVGRDQIGVRRDGALTQQIASLACIFFSGERLTHHPIALLSERPSPIAPPWHALRNDRCFDGSSLCYLSPLLLNDSAVQRERGRPCRGSKKALKAKSPIRWNRHCQNPFNP